ncbi:MAG: hypothetical protein JXO22_14880, partial [Phycisphaerae bacterium]|nr:hypothetical protein [Phycisphaerae bacterium]
MPSNQAQSQTAATGENAASAPANAFRRLVELADGTTSRHRYLREALACIARVFGSPYATLSAQYDSEVVSEEFHSGQTSPAFWREPVRDFLADALADGEPHARLLSAHHAKLQIGLLSAPFTGRDGEMTGGFALVCPVTRTEVAALAAHLQALVTLAAHLADNLNRPGDSRHTSGASNHALAHAATMESPEEMAFSITNSLRNKLGCEQVALGVVHGPHVKIISISGLDDVRQRSPGAVQIRAAMEECLDAGVPLAAAKEHEWAEQDSGTSHRLHRQWRTGAGGAAVASIPISVGDKIAAVLSLRRASTDGFRREQIEQIRQTVEPFIAAMQLVAEARRGVLRHLGGSVRDTVKATFEPRRWGRKLAALMALAATIWFAFGTLSY